MFAVIGFLKTVPSWVWLVLAAASFCFMCFRSGEHIKDMQWQKKWDAQQAAYAKAASDAEAKNATALKEATAHNQEIIDAYHQVSDARDAAVADAALAHSLLDATRRALGRPVPKAADKPGVIAAPVNDGDAELTKLLSLEADALTECNSNAAKQNALIAELKGQL